MSKTTKVIMLQPEGKLLAGRIVEVSPGYARNHLFPKRLALHATRENIIAFKAQEQAMRAADARALETALELSNAIKYGIFPIVVSALHGDRLYGSVGKREIANALQAVGHEITAAQILDFGRPIQKLGSYEIDYRLRPEVMGTFTVNVIRDAPEASANFALDSTLSVELYWHMSDYPAIIVAPVTDDCHWGGITLLEPIDAATAAKAITKTIVAFKEAGVLSCARQITAEHLTNFETITLAGMHGVNVSIRDDCLPTALNLIVYPSLEQAKGIAYRCLPYPRDERLNTVVKAALDMSGPNG